MQQADSQRLEMRAVGNVRAGAGRRGSRGGRLCCTHREHELIHGLLPRGLECAERAGSRRKRLWVRDPVPLRRLGLGWDPLQRPRLGRAVLREDQLLSLLARHVLVHAQRLLPRCAAGGDREQRLHQQLRELGNGMHDGLGHQHLVQQAARHRRDLVARLLLLRVVGKPALQLLPAVGLGLGGAPVARLGAPSVPGAILFLLERERHVLHDRARALCLPRVHVHHVPAAVRELQLHRVVGFPRAADLER